MRQSELQMPDVFVGGPRVSLGNDPKHFFTLFPDIHTSTALAVSTKLEPHTDIYLYQCKRDTYYTESVTEQWLALVTNNRFTPIKNLFALIAIVSASFDHDNETLYSMNHS